MQFPDKSKFPPAPIIEWNVLNPCVIRRYLHLSLGQGTDTLSTKFADKEAQLENHVLSSTRIESISVILKRTGIVRCQ